MNVFVGRVRTCSSVAAPFGNRHPLYPQTDIVLDRAAVLI
jgi:hypothetical protein